MKRLFWTLLTLIITFIFSAVLFGDWHSALSVIIGFAVGMGVCELMDREII